MTQTTTLTARADYAAARQASDAAWLALQAASRNSGSDRWDAYDAAVATYDAAVAIEEAAAQAAIRASLA